MIVQFPDASLAVSAFVYHQGEQSGLTIYMYFSGDWFGCRQPDIGNAMLNFRVPDHGQVRAVFAYGCLRGDYSRSGDKWGIIADTGASFLRGCVIGYKLFEDTHGP